MIRKIVFALSLLLAAAAPAASQFADQATYAGAGGGTANAQTLTLANASSYADLTGVIVKYVPTATNTGAATMTVNGFGSSPAFRKPSGSGMTALTGSEIVSGQPTYVMYDGTYFNLVSPTSLPIGAAQLQNSALSFGMPVNLQINATVGSNQLTVAIKGLDGNDPSGTNAVLVPFRNVTIASGQPTIVSLQTALSMTVNSTNTMGCVSGQMCRLWVVLFNNGGTAAIGLFNALSGTNIAPINEAALQSSASGTTGGSSAQTYYASTSSITSKSIRIIGYIDIQQVTAGTWASGPTYIQLFGPGIKKPGDPVQPAVSNFTATSGTTSSATFAALSSGQTQAITPTSAANLIRVRLHTSIGIPSGPVGGFIQIARTTTPIGMINGGYISSGTSSFPASLEVVDLPNTTSSVTYSVYGKVTGGGSISVPASNGAQGGGFLSVEEIMGEAPLTFDNDNDQRLLNMVG